MVSGVGEHVTSINDAGSRAETRPKPYVISLSTKPQTRATGVKSRGLCVPHFARIFFIAFTLAAASCASERAQKEEAETKEAARQLTAAYYSCVRTSFASQVPTMVDRNMAIDQAFLVCKTEESKLHAFENTLSGNPNVAMRPSPPTAMR